MNAIIGSYTKAEAFYNYEGLAYWSPDFTINPTRDFTEHTFIDGNT